MSITAEQIRAQLAARRAAKKKLTAADIRSQLAARRAAQVGTESFGAPDPSDERTFLERLKQGGAAALESVLETGEGIQDLQEVPAPLQPGMARRQAALQSALGAVREQAAPEGSPSRIAGNILGDVATMAVPASMGYRAGRALQGLPGVRSRFTRPLAPIAGETAAVAGTEALKVPEEGRTRAGVAAETAAYNLAGAGALRAAQKAINPRTFSYSPIAQEEVDELARAGIRQEIPISMAGTETETIPGRIAKWMHRRPLASVPPTARPIREQQEQALENWQDYMVKQVVPENAKITPPSRRTGDNYPFQSTFKDIDDWYRKEYSEVLDPHKFDTVDGPFFDDVSDAIAQIPGENARRAVSDKVDELVADLMDSQGQLSGSNISRLKTSLRRAGNKLDIDPEIKEGYSMAVEGIDNSVTKQLAGIDPELAARYEALRAPYRRRVVLEDAVKLNEGGDFTPRSVLQASKSKATSERAKGRWARGESPLQREAQRAEQVYEFPTNTSDSNIFQAQALTGMLGVGAGTVAPSMALGPVVGAPISAAMGAPSAIGLSRAGARYLRGDTAMQRRLQRAADDPRMKELARLLRLTGTQYGTE